MQYDASIFPMPNPDFVGSYRVIYPSTFPGLAVVLVWDVIVILHGLGTSIKRDEYLHIHQRGHSLHFTPGM
jgi:hypothetical protein